MTSFIEPGREGSQPRRVYIDWARALAILVMIEAHTLDAWTRVASRQAAAFGYATVLNGFAAPLFLWLAGVSLVFSAAKVARREGRRAAGVEAVCRRGLEVFVLAFLFRLQGFLVTPGSHPVKLFRVDILNIMGPSIALAGLAWGVASATRGGVAFYAAIAAAFAMLTPIVRATPLVDELPTWVQWYLRPAGDLTTFTMFPWAGFVFAGAAAGLLLAPVRSAATERRLQMGLATTGATLVAAGFYAATRPSIYPSSSFWTSSPTYFTIRVGVLMGTVAAIYGLTLFADRRGFVLRPLERFGRHSLFVYWIHVELVYGYATSRLRGQLPLWGSFCAYVAFTALMYVAVVLKDHFDAWWHGRRRPSGRGAQTATA